MNISKQKVGIWLRSAIMEKNNLNLKKQEKKLRVYAEEKDLNIDLIYRLEGKSGLSVLSTSEAQKMLDDVKNNKINILLVTEPSRLSRNHCEYIQMTTDLEKHNVEYIFVDKLNATTTSFGSIRDLLYRS